MFLLTDDCYNMGCHKELSSYSTVTTRNVAWLELLSLKMLNKLLFSSYNAEWCLTITFLDFSGELFNINTIL